MEHPLQQKPLQKALSGLRNLSISLKSAASDTLDNLSASSTSLRSSAQPVQLPREPLPIAGPAPSVGTHQAQVHPEFASRIALQPTTLWSQAFLTCLLARFSRSICSRPIHSHHKRLRKCICGPIRIVQVDFFKKQLRQGGAINMANVRAVASDGCPDTGNLRLIAWKVILHRP